MSPSGGPAPPGRGRRARPARLEHRAHRIEEQSLSPIPLVSIVGATADAAEGSTRLGLFATTFTLRADLYPTTFARRGIDVIASADDDQELIRTKYMDELVDGQFLA